MEIPRTLEQLQSLIDNRLEESIRLDYKESTTFGKSADGIRKDLAKDVSAFANSDGGVMVYGVVEVNRLLVRLDDGVLHAEWPAERVENVITSNVSPRIPDLEVVQVRASDTRSYFVVRIGKSYRGPHQSTIEKRYFKRFNFKAEPMEDYEIRDVMNRRDVVTPLISVEVDVRWGALIDLVVKNIGDVAAEDVKFEISPPVEKLEKAPLLTEGTSFFPPGRIFRYFLASAHKRISRENALRFSVVVSYVNRRASARTTETFRFDLSDFLMTAIVDSDIARHSKKLEESLNKMTSEIKRTNDRLESIATIAGGTGLDLSIRTLRNLRVVASEAGTEFQRLPARGLSADAFVEVLGVDFHTGVSLSHFAEWGEGRLEGVEDLTPDVVARAREAFDFDEPPLQSD